MTAADPADQVGDGMVLAHLGLAEGGEIHMATWVVELAFDAEGEGVTLTYTGNDGVRQRCGRSEVILLLDVIAFASDQADPCDRVVTPAGTFVRLRRPGLPA